MELIVIGTGYVGLVSGTCFAEMGHRVTCLDISQEKIDALHRGEIPIYEPGLEELVKRNINAGRLKFTSSYETALTDASVAFLAVDTPMGDDGAANLTSLKTAVTLIGKHMQREMIIVIKSTAPVGTAHKVLRWCESFDHPVHIVSNPEFLKEGSAVQDFMKPDRVVIGADEKAAAKALLDIYAPFTFNRERIMVMDVLSAEMTKYAANAMLAARISLMNEFATICEMNGADINKVRRGIGSDSRIGYSFLYAGLGYGGSCFPKDIQALRAQAKNFGVQTPIMDAVDAVNTVQKQKIGTLIEAHFGNIKGLTIAIWGLSFKPETDDMRSAPSLVLIQQLISRGANVRLFDPVAEENAKKVLPDDPHITWCTSELEAATGADAIALVTEWKQFRHINFDEVRTQMKGNAFFDGRNQYNPDEMSNKGFYYYCIGNRAKHLTVRT